jgi:hypothetical protein
MENPNEYNDEAWLSGSIRLAAAVHHLWSAGASVETIREIVDHTLGVYGLALALGGEEDLQ